MPRPRVIAALLLLYLLIAILTSHPFSTRPGETLPDNADALAFSWAMSWVCHQIGTDPVHLLKANIYHPDPAPLAYGEPMLGEALLACPVYAVTKNDVVTFNVTFVLTLTLAAFTMFLLSYEVTGHLGASILAGEIFSFTTANYESAARIQIVSNQWTPLALFFLVRLFKHRRLRDAIGLGLAFTMQGWACNYYKLFFATLLILIAPILFACLPRPRLAHLPWKGLLLSMAIAFVLFLPLDALQFINLQRTDTARAARIGALPHTSYWRTVPENLLYGWLFGESYVSYDDRYFLGLIPPLLAIIGLLALVPRIRRRAVAIEMSIDWRVLTPLLALGFFAFAFGCGKDLPTPWGDVPGPYNLLHNYIPGYQHTRVPSRFVMFVRVIVALLAAIGVVALLRSRWRGRVMRAALTAMALLIPLEHLAWPQPHWRISSGDRVPKAYHWLKTLPPGTPMLEFPPHSLNFRRWESWWMHLSTTHWLPIVNGFGSYYPTSYNFIYEMLLDDFPGQRSLRMLRSLGVEYVVVHPSYDRESKMGRAYERFLHRYEKFPGIRAQLQPVIQFDDAGWYRDRMPMLGGERIYRLVGDRPRKKRIDTSAWKGIERAGWTCTSEPANGTCARAIDGDLATSFTTESEQLTGHNIRIFLKTPIVLRGVRLVCGRQALDYPRSVQISVLRAGVWTAIAHEYDEVDFLTQMLERPERAALDLATTANAAEAIEIRLNNAEPGFSAWTQPEIELMGEPQS